jgi:hypothetical protein
MAEFLGKTTSFEIDPLTCNPVYQVGSAKNYEMAALSNLVPRLGRRATMLY